MTEGLEAFQAAGRTLFSFGLVKGAEGNLSSFDGERLAITRTGCSLAALSPEDVLVGTLEEAPEGSSSDLEVHVSHYRRSGPGSVAHAHPPGSVPQGWREGEPHGVYAFAPLLEEAVAVIVEEVRARAARAGWEDDGGAVEG